MLIFISQFSQGIDMNDFNILSTYDRAEARNEGVDMAVIDIPIDKNWQRRLNILLENSLERVDSKTDSESETIDTHVVSLDKRTTHLYSDYNSGNPLVGVSPHTPPNANSPFSLVIIR